MRVGRRLAVMVLFLFVVASSAGCQRHVAAPAPSPVQPAVSSGERLYMDGVGHAGALERTDAKGAWVSVGGGCSGCHGVDGAGTDTVPPVDMGSLGAKHEIMHMSALDSAPRVVFVHGSGHTATPAVPSETATAPATAPVPAPAPTEGPWSEAQVLEVVRTGTTPEGYELSAAMPRWRLDDTDGPALVEFLRGLKP